jgi:hypothetical protein
LVIGDLAFFVESTFELLSVSTPNRKGGNRMRIKTVLILCIIGGFLGLSVNCYALSYTEETFPDLAGQSVGSLDLGENAVIGSVFLDVSGENISFDKDSFYFVIDSGSILNSITLAFNTDFIDNGDEAMLPLISFELSDDVGNAITVANFVNVLNTDTFELFPDLNLEVGTYEFNTWSINSHTGDYFKTNYMLTLQVDQTAPVPEPSTIVLMGLGLVGLAGFGRKKFKK